MSEHPLTELDRLKIEVVRARAEELGLTPEIAKALSNVLGEAFSAMAASVADTLAENAALRQLVKDAEWIAATPLAFCPWCDGEEPTHEPDCEALPFLGDKEPQP
jgi:hypothetical protein